MEKIGAVKSFMNTVITFVRLARRILCTVKVLFILLALLAVLVYLNFVHPYDFYDVLLDWDFLEPTLALITLTVAVYIFWQESREALYESLPNRLDVIFKCDGYAPFQISGQNLTSAADIRQWGQQLGRQSAGGEDLKLKHPYFDPPEVQYAMWDKGKKYKERFYNQHTLVFYLKEWPGNKFGRGQESEPQADPTPASGEGLEQ